MQPNDWTYNARVRVHSGVEDFDAALDAMQQMQADGVMPSQGTWDVILSAAQSVGRHDVIEQVVTGGLAASTFLHLALCPRNVAGVASST